MSESNATIIDGYGESATGRGLAGISATPNGNSGVKGGNNYAEIIVDGSNDGVEPSTIRIADPATRRNRTGGIDGRTRAGRARRNDNGTGAGGTGDTTAPPAPSDSLVDITAILFNIHAGVASILNAEIIAITKDEAQELSDAVRELSKHYPVAFLTPKRMAIVNCLTVAGKVYGTRAMTYQILKGQKESAKPKPQLVPKQTTAPVTPQKTNGAAAFTDMDLSGVDGPDYN